MKKTVISLMTVLVAGWTASAQVTNVMVAETNQIRLEWTAMSGNPYRVYASQDLVEPAWSNLTPLGLTFEGSQGSCTLPAGNQRTYYCAIASDYLVVDLSDGPASTNYPVSYTNAQPEGGWKDEHKTTKLVLRRIPGGSFTMGSPDNELGRSSNEIQHVVTLTKDFYIGVFEVTQRQWERVMEDWPSNFSNMTFRDSRPVEGVSYDDIRGAMAGTNWPADGNVDADSFMGKLRAKTGLATLDLPTEAQWEYACRAGATTALNSGYNLASTSNDLRMAEVGRYWYNGGSLGYWSDGGTNVGSAKVGSYLPNAWGLFDMHGNVWESCLDWRESSPAGVLDPVGPVSGSHRVIRGGCWIFSAWGCRSAGLSGYLSASRGDYGGFRVALSPSQ